MEEREEKEGRGRKGKRVKGREAEGKGGISVIPLYKYYVRT